jgi:OmpA-like transmembrane domain
MQRLLLIAALAVIAIPAAHAQIPEGYVGAGLTESTIGDVFRLHRDFDMSTSWKLFAGVRPIPPLGLEMNYMDFGSQTHSFNNTYADAHAFTAFAVGFLPVPLPFLEVFGKAGASRWTLGGHTYSSLFSIDDHGTSFAWGGGAQFHFGAFGARLEYEQFDVRDASQIRAVTAGVMFNFL